MDEEKTVDVVVVGTGAGGLTAALVAKTAGADVLTLEKAEHIGGTSSWSGGVSWVPDNDLMRAAGVSDTPEAALEYLESVIGDGDRAATSTARKTAYVRSSPEAIRFLQGCGVEFIYADGATDYYPENPGGLTRGRSLNATIFDTRRLGDWEPWFRPQSPESVFPVILKHYAEAPPMATMFRSITGMKLAAAVAARTGWGKLRRKHLVCLGQALMAQLMFAAKQHQVEIWRSAPVTDLIVVNGRAVGVRVLRGGREITVRARQGVLLVAGGYARNDTLRKEFRDPASGSWTKVIPEDTGDMIIAAERHGAATDLMDEAIWTPVSVTPDGSVVAHLWERWLPHAIIVDATGQRFVNESTSYMAVGQAMYDRNTEVPAIPSWLIIDTHHRRRYPFGSALPGFTPNRWIESGYLKKAATVEELAVQCSIPPEQLLATVERFNRFAEAGKDNDFHRGDSAFDKYFHDPTVKPCSVLGPITKPPFYAVALYPGDVSTYGGLVTDEHARVLRTDGSVFDGLYAAGSTAASVCGHTYPGAGVAVGGSITFGYIGAQHILTLTSETRADADQDRREG